MDKNIGRSLNRVSWEIYKLTLIIESTMSVHKTALKLIHVKTRTESGLNIFIIQ